MNTQKTERLAEVRVGQYYAYKTKVHSLDRAMWYDMNGIVVDSGLELLLEELSRPRPDVGEEVREVEKIISDVQDAAFFIEPKDTRIVYVNLDVLRSLLSKQEGK